MANAKSIQVSISDIEDAVMKSIPGNILDKSSEYGGSAVNEYRRSGSMISESKFIPYAKSLIDQSFKYMGHGGSGNLLQNFVSRIDRHGRVIAPMNSLNYGYTFITRPRLNLSGGNIKQDSLLSGLYTRDPSSIPFMIRMLLDTRLCNGEVIMTGRGGAIVPDIELDQMHLAAIRSGLVDVRNPFMVPMMNALKGISGYPDFTVETETTDADFYSSDYTFAKGSDRNQRSTELSLEFRDTPGSIILAIAYYWAYYVALQTLGVVDPYPDDIYEKRLNYTFSIYRFVTDHTRQRIHHWSKATGCIIKSVPIGSIFNISQGETFITSAANFSIPVAVNKIEYNKPGILEDFNALMRRYANGIHDLSKYPKIGDHSAQYNFMGLPYISFGKTSINMDWRTSPVYHDTMPSNGVVITSGDAVLNDKESNLNNILSNMNIA